MWVWLWACTADDEGESSGCEADAGTATATVDGEDWTGPGVTFVWSGSSLQLTTQAGGSYYFNMVVQATGDGTAAADADVPFDVTLGDGGFVTVYGEGGSSYSTNNTDGGTVTVASVSDEEVTACFSFEAATNGGDVVSFEDGTLAAAPF